jgi:hypothetical protein
MVFRIKISTVKNFFFWNSKSRFRVFFFKKKEREFSSDLREKVFGKTSHSLSLSPSLLLSLVKMPGKSRKAESKRQTNKGRKRSQKKTKGKSGKGNRKRTSKKGTSKKGKGKSKKKTSIKKMTLVKDSNGCYQVYTGHGNAKNRKGPARSATEFPEGTQRAGLEEGTVWQVVTSSKGINRWVKIKK